MDTNNQEVYEEQSAAPRRKKKKKKGLLGTRRVHLRAEIIRKYMKNNPLLRDVRKKRKKGGSFF